MRFNTTHARCPRCNLRENICICAAIPTLTVATRVILIMHLCESRKTTNTGRLIHLALPDSKLFCHGQRHLPRPLEHEVSRDGSTYLLYPDDSAEELNAEFTAKLQKPITLVVPDGNWKQARKMSHSIPELLTLPRVRVPVPNGSSYRLRRAPRNGMLCTIEAVAAALGALEGEEIQTALEGVLEELTKRIFWSRKNAGPYQSQATALTMSLSV